MSQSQGIYINTLNQDGTAPKTRLSDAEQAGRVYQRMWQGYNYGRGKINAKVQAAINGNPPIPQARLDAEGLGWMTNVNFRLLEADVNTAQVPLYNLFSDVPQYCNVIVDCPKYTAIENNYFGSILAAKHKWLMKKWRQFDHNMQLSIANMAKYGSGPVYFPSKNDFRFRAATQGSVFVPDESSQNLDELPMLFFYYEWEISDLFRYIDKPGAAKAGWEVETVKKVLIDSVQEFSGYTRNRSWEYWQQKLREEDVYWSQVVPRIRTAWGYVKEFNGKITRFLIVANQTQGWGKYLFHKQDEFDCWEQIIHPFFAEIGNGNWNGVKGIGIKAYNFRDAQNKLKNRMLDAAFLGSQILIQAPDAKTAEDLQLLQVGPMAIIPQGVTFNQMPLMSTLDKPLMVDRQLEQDLRNNIGGLRQGSTDAQSGQPESATGRQIDASYSSQLTQAQQNIYLNQLDYLYTEQFHRLAEKPRIETKSYPYEPWEKLHKEFWDQCIEEGVPAEAFKHIRSVSACRSIGRGSEFAKQQIGTQVYNLLRSDPNVPQRVIVNHLRNTISNFTGREYLEMIWPEEQIDVSPTNDASKAQDENAGMLVGVPPIWTPDQNNLEHAKTHLQFFGMQLQQAQQSGNPQQVISFSQQAIPHIHQTLQALQSQSGDGKLFQQLFNALEQMSAQVKQLAQQMQQAQQAAAQKQAQEQQKAAMQNHATTLEAAKAQAEIRRQDAIAAAEIKRKDALARVDISHKAMKTHQDLSIKSMTAQKEMEEEASEAEDSEE